MLHPKPVMDISTDSLEDLFFQSLESNKVVLLISIIDIIIPQIQSLKYESPLVYCFRFLFSSFGNYFLMLEVKVTDTCN